MHKHLGVTYIIAFMSAFFCNLSAMKDQATQTECERKNIDIAIQVDSQDILYQSSLISNESQREPDSESDESEQDDKSYVVINKVVRVVNEENLDTVWREALNDHGFWLSKSNVQTLLLEAEFAEEFPECIMARDDVGGNIVEIVLDQAIQANSINILDYVFSWARRCRILDSLVNFAYSDTRQTIFHLAAACPDVVLYLLKALSRESYFESLVTYVDNAGETVLNTLVHSALHRSSIEFLFDVLSYETLRKLLLTSRHLNNGKRWSPFYESIARSTEGVYPNQCHVEIVRLFLKTAQKAGCLQELLSMPDVCYAVANCPTKNYSWMYVEKAAKTVGLERQFKLWAHDEAYKGFRWVA